MVPAAATFAAAFASTGPFGPTKSFPTPGPSPVLKSSGVTLNSIFAFSDASDLILENGILLAVLLYPSNAAAFSRLFLFYKDVI